MGLWFTSQPNNKGLVCLSTYCLLYVSIHKFQLTPMGALAVCFCTSMIRYMCRHTHKHTHTHTLYLYQGAICYGWRDNEKFRKIKVTLLKYKMSLHLCPILHHRFQRYYCVLECRGQSQDTWSFSQDLESHKKVPMAKGDVYYIN